MATKKISLNELRSIVKQIIKEESDNNTIIKFFDNHKKEILTKIEHTFTEELLNNEMGGIDNIHLKYNNEYKCYEIYYKYGNADIFISENVNDLKKFENINDILRMSISGKILYIVSVR